MPAKVKRGAIHGGRIIKNFIIYSKKGYPSEIDRQPLIVNNTLLLALLASHVMPYLIIAWPILVGEEEAVHCV